MSESMTAIRAPVYDFDYQLDPILREDVHAGYLKIKKEAPPVFWTPKNGGHWVVNNAEAATTVLRHPEIYSSQFLSIPPNPAQPKMIPESLDPPEHKPYRQLLRPFFEGKAIAPLEGWITECTEKIIDEITPQGSCEFVDAVASRLPVSVFMEMFGFPMGEFEGFRTLVVRYFAQSTKAEQQQKLSQEILGHLTILIQARMAEPKDDLISKLIQIDFEGRKLTFEELISIGFLMFLAGLDTVTNAMTFGMRHLANDENLRQRIIDDPDCIAGAVEELMRRYTFVSTPRYLVQDTELQGIELKAGDSILVPLMTVGWDDKLNPDPETVTLDRPTCRHAGFGSGVHTCLGLHLARMELIIFYRIWFAKIGHFREVETGEAPRTRAGSVMALESLQLAWD